MAKTIIAHPSTEPTTPEVRQGDLEHVSGIAARVLRGRQLYEERSNEIEWITGDQWFVPASDLLTGRYVVRIGNNPSCECADYQHRHRNCYHIAAGLIAAAKSTPCSCCARRVRNRHLTEVVEDDALLGWFVGDLICADCVAAGFWA